MFDAQSHSSAAAGSQQASSSASSSVSSSASSSATPGGASSTGSTASSTLTSPPPLPPFLQLALADRSYVSKAYWVLDRRDEKRRDWRKLAQMERDEKECSRQHEESKRATAVATGFSFGAGSDGVEAGASGAERSLSSSARSFETYATTSSACSGSSTASQAPSVPSNSSGSPVVPPLPLPSGASAFSRAVRSAKTHFLKRTSPGQLLSLPPLGLTDPSHQNGGSMNGKVEDMQPADVEAELKSAFGALAGQAKCNQPRNRYQDVKPYDRTRVVLPKTPSAYPFSQATAPSWKDNGATQRANGVAETPACCSQALAMHGDGEDSYINASWVEEPDLAGRGGKTRRWIASQAPIRRRGRYKSTLYDFWQLVLTQNVSTILMVTRLVENNIDKADRYWPTAEEGSLVLDLDPGAPISVPRPSSHPGSRGGESLTSSFSPSPGVAGRITVTWKDVEEVPAAGAEVTTFEIRARAAPWLRTGDGKEETITHTVRHVQYLGWSDHGVPEDHTQLLRLVELVEEQPRYSLSHSSQDGAAGKADEQESTPSPVLVHCSAGVGRTGTFIAIASIRRHLPHLLSSISAASSTHAPPSSFLSTNPIPVEPTRLSTLLMHPFSSPYYDGSPAKQAAMDVAAVKPFVCDVVFWTVDALRNQRVMMVQTEPQLALVYKVAADAWEELGRRWTRESLEQRQG